MDCLFCKIVNKEVPAAILYEDDATVVFLDIRPVTAGHSLVVPKHHSVNLLDADPGSLERMIRVTQKVAQAVMKATETFAFNVKLNNGSEAGQLVPHLHWHLIPRKGNDKLPEWPHGNYEPGAADALLKRIHEVLEK